MPSKRLEEFQTQCQDLSLQVALNSVIKDVNLRKGSLVCAYALPRCAAKKFVYVIGGSHREMGSAWTKEEYTYDSVECYDIYAKEWRQVTLNLGNGNLACNRTDTVSHEDLIDIWCVQGGS